MHPTKNKYWTAKGIALFLLLSFTRLQAQEPANLSFVKESLVQYHNSGEYEKDISQVIETAIQYLSKNQLNKIKRPAIVFDIDETALSNFRSMQELSFGGTLKEIQHKENQAKDPVIKPTLKLYQFARNHHIATFFISGRPEHERYATVVNLHRAGYKKWDGLMMKPPKYKKTSAAIFKTAMRKKLAAKGYDIVVNIGDQTSDLIGGYARQTFKLPNPFYVIK